MFAIERVWAEQNGGVNGAEGAPEAVEREGPLPPSAWPAEVRGGILRVFVAAIEGEPSPLRRTAACKALVSSALVCRSWRDAALPLLPIGRLHAARAGLRDAAPAVTQFASAVLPPPGPPPWVSELLTGAACPGAPVIQLLHSLQLLWPKAHAAWRLQGGASAAEGKRATSEAGIHQTDPCAVSVPAPASGAAPAELSLSSQAWRYQVWGEAKDTFLAEEDFPAALAAAGEALSRDRALLEGLRARTGRCGRWQGGRGQMRQREVIHGGALLRTIIPLPPPPPLPLQR